MKSVCRVIRQQALSVMIVSDRNTLMSTSHVTRFSVSLPAALQQELDAMVLSRGLGNRSQAIAEMIRDRLVEHHRHQEKQPIVGTITLVYDHHKRDLQTVLTGLQHDHSDLIVSTLHVHLDHDHCLEVLVVRGPAGKVRSMADALLAAKGVLHARLTVTTTGHDLHH